MTRLYEIAAYIGSACVDGRNNRRRLGQREAVPRDGRVGRRGGRPAA